MLSRLDDEAFISLLGDWLQVYAGTVPQAIALYDQKEGAPHGCAARNAAGCDRGEPRGVSARCVKVDGTGVQMRERGTDLRTLRGRAMFAEEVQPRSTAAGSHAKAERPQRVLKRLDLPIGASSLACGSGRRGARSEHR